MSYKYCNVKLADTNKILFKNVRIPNSFINKAKGLLGEDKHSDNAYMLFEACNSIHMFGMRIPLDVVFLSSEGLILKCVKHLKPWKLTYCFKSSKTLELPAGTLEKFKLEKNMKLEINECIKPQ